MRIRLIIMMSIAAAAPPAGGCKQPTRQTPTKKEPAASGARHRAAEKDLPAPRWPGGFEVQRTDRVPAAQLAGFSGRLGAPVESLTRYHLAAGETRAQVNIIRAADSAAARRIHERMRTLHRGKRTNLALQGKIVVEYVRTGPLLSHRFKESMGLLDSRPRRYRIRARLGLLKSGDAADATRLLNLMLRPRPGESAWSEAVAQIVRGFSFEQTLSLRRAGSAGKASTYTLTPPATKVRAAGPVSVFTFGALENQRGVPFVDVVASIRTAGWTPIPGARPGPALTAATAAWPTADSAIQSRVARLTRGRDGARKKLVALHAWVNRTIRYGGRAGARDGTLTVLKRGFGRCWEKTDVLITLLRAAGLPARQVAGWIVGGSGHIWAEVFIAGEGWISVDSTAPWLGVSGDYIPLMISGDGRLNVLHLRMPRIEPLEE